MYTAVDTERMQKEINLQLNQASLIDSALIEYMPKKSHKSSILNDL